MVFKRIDRDDQGQFSFSSQMLRVYLELDGKKSVETISQKNGLDRNTMREVIAKLWEAHLIEPLEDGTTQLGQAFLGHVHLNLSKAVGPIAQILIEEALVDLGIQPSQIPRHRAAEIVDLLAREIQREDKRDTFKQNMWPQLKEISS
jgi:hypothetical protein